MFKSPVFLKTILLVATIILLSNCSEPKEEFTETEKLEFIEELLLNSTGINSSNDFVFYTKNDDEQYYRDFKINIGVTNIHSELKRREGETDEEMKTRFRKLFKLANVESAEVHVFYSSDKLNWEMIPDIPSYKSLKKMGFDIDKSRIKDSIFEFSGINWDYIYSSRAIIDQESTTDSFFENEYSLKATQPIYDYEVKIQTKDRKGKKSYSIPNGYIDSLFFNDHELSTYNKFENDGILNTKSFLLRFIPFRGEGWYYIKFLSKTNRILDLGIYPAVEKKYSYLNGDYVSSKYLLKYIDYLLTTLDEYDLPSVEEIESKNSISKEEKELLRGKIETAKWIAKKKSYKDLQQIKFYEKLFGSYGSNRSAFTQSIGDLEFFIKVRFSDTKD
jgi:hypothetical protein